MSTYQDQFEKFFDKVWKNLPADLQRTDGFQETFKLQMKNNNKRLGQLIAKSWLHESDPEGQRIRDVLVGDLNEPSANRSKKIIDFFRKDYDIDITNLVPDDRGNGLVETVEVKWDKFDGDLAEGNRTYYLPYPPRPVEVTDEQLQAWIEDSEREYPSTPYIPLTGF